MAFLSFKFVNGKKIAEYENLNLSYKFLNKLVKRFPEIEYALLIDASLIYKIDNPQALERNIQNNEILQCPAEIAADSFLLEFMHQFPNETIIISNDRFQNYPIPEVGLIPWRYPAMKICGKIIVPNLLENLENLLNGFHITAPEISKISQIGGKDE